MLSEKVSTATSVVRVAPNNVQSVNLTVGTRDSTVRNYHLQEQPIPEGYQIYEERLEVSGVVHRKKEAQAFVRSSKKWLEFERDLGNPYDENAIKIIGCVKRLFGTKRRHVGFVPPDVVKRMVDANVDGAIRPRLLKSYLGDSGFVEILFQIIGPKGKIHGRKAPELAEEPHYTDFVDRIKWLKAEKRHEEAIELLFNLVQETEDEAAAEGFGVAPWYYEQLAILLRKEKRYGDEVLILERYEAQPKARGAKPAKLAARLVRAREARDKKHA